MKLVKMIPLHLVKVSLDSLRLGYSEFTFVVSQGYLKIYKQVR
jgi:hypothetical protein